MKLTDKDIDFIENFGEISGKEVRLIRTKGGFHMAMGMRPGSNKEECLTAGSHPALLRFNLQKQFRTYAPSMMKSSNFASNAVVDNHSHFLSDDLRKSGHEIHSIQNGTHVTFHVSRGGLKVADVDAYLQDGSLVLPSLKAPSQFSRGLAGAVTEKGFAMGADTVTIEG